MRVADKHVHVSLLAIPDAVLSTISGIYDVMNGLKMLGVAADTVPDYSPFTVEIVAEKTGPVHLASGLPIETHRSIAEVKSTDIIIMPSILLTEAGWQKGRYKALVEWVSRMHASGALLCSACSGIFLLAETGLFDGHDVTVHWGYRQEFTDLYPEISLHPDQVLIVTGDREELITSGASMTWHDLVLYLIARHIGSTKAQAVAKFFALQWHYDGLAPFIVFEGKKDHGDAVVAECQHWLSANFSVSSPVDELIKRSGLPNRTFKRRFKKATGISPISYVQRLRVEEAKRRLERTTSSIEEISWNVGYEDPASFRKLFKRTTGLSPGTYRKRFKIPKYAESTKTVVK